MDTDDPKINRFNEKTTPTRLALRGGTAVSHSPSIDYVTAVTLPLLRRMGLAAEARVHRRGYFPQGGGHIEVGITPLPPGRTLQPVELVDAGRPTRVLAFVSGVVNGGGTVERLAEGFQGAAVVRPGFALDVFLKTGPVHNNRLSAGAIRQAVGAAAQWSQDAPSSSSSSGGPLPVDFTLTLERQQQQQQAQQQQGKRQRTGGRGGWRPKREVLHVLLVLETSTGCRLGADVLVEQQDLWGYRPPSMPMPGPGLGGKSDAATGPVDPFALERVNRLVETLQVRAMGQLLRMYPAA